MFYLCSDGVKTPGKLVAMVLRRAQGCGHFMKCPAYRGSTEAGFLLRKPDGYRAHDQHKYRQGDKHPLKCIAH